MTNPSKDRGTKAESALVAYLNANGFPHAERRALRGKDCGDIAGIPGVVIEVKSVARVDLAGWVAEARAEAGNAGAPVWFVAAKARGKGLGRVDEWYAITSVGQMCELLADDSGAGSVAS